MKDLVADIRKDYTLKTLDITDLNPNPISQFRLWMEEAIHAQVPEVNAFVLSTVSAEGKPSGRVVLLRDGNESGFSFFTNYLSRKGEDIAATPYASATFFWEPLQRQVRIAGTIEKLSATDSDEYFASRPRESQLGAWASHQSQILDTRQTLEERLIELDQQYKDQPIPRPPHWGGYLIKPTEIEFWQGRTSRLHDRFLYTLKGTSWGVVRLNP